MTRSSWSLGGVKKIQFGSHRFLLIERALHSFFSWPPEGDILDRLFAKPALTFC